MNPQEARIRKYIPRVAEELFLRNHSEFECGASFERAMSYDQFEKALLTFALAMQQHIEEDNVIIPNNS